MKARFSQRVFDSRDVADKAAVWHKVERGILFDLFYDTETTDLNKRFAEITQFGGLITDLAGNPLHQADFKGRVSDYNLISPYAWVIQRLHERDLQDGDSQYILAGKIMQFFRQANNLQEAPFAKSFLQMCHYTGPKGDRDGYYSYPLRDENGEVDWDCIRIHEGLKKYYYRDVNSGQWIKRDIAAMSIGYNNVNADDQWLWTLLHMAGAENIFITHLAQMGKYRLDGLRAVEAAYAAGPKGEHGIQPAYKINPATGENVLSFSQGDILEANTRIAAELRGVLEGITLPDGSYPDIDQLHGAFKDAVALAGLMKYLRRQTPDILRQMERNTVWKDVVERLTEKQGGFGNHPILSYVDKTFPYLNGQMVTLIGTDQYRHNPKTAILFNLSVDPRTFTFNGRPLKDLTPEEYAHLITAGKSNQNGIFKVIRTHQSPRLLDQDTGMQAGFNNGLEGPELHARAKFLRDSEFIEKVMAGLRIAQPRLSGPGRLGLPQPEEELFTFATLEMHDPDAGEDVQIHRATNHIEKLAQDSRYHAMQVKKFWLKAIEPDEDILLSDFGKDREAEREAIERFKDKIKTLNKKLKEHHAQCLPEPDDALDSAQAALKYKIKILFYARNYFATGQLLDIGHHFWFEDSQGHRIDEQELKTWPQWRIDEASKSGNLNICHERLNVTAPIIDRIIEGLGYGEILGEHVQRHLEADKALKHYGIPAQTDDRWYTLGDARLDTQKLLTNGLMDEDVKALEGRMPGVWSIFMTRHHDAQASLGSYLQYLEEKEKRFPRFTPVQQVRVGIDPRTGMPIERVDYEIDPDKTLYVQVPDRYLAKPPTDPITKKPTWLIPLSRSFNKSALDAAMKRGCDVVLCGQKTGKKLHLPKAVMAPLPKSGGPHEDFYKAARARYEESGIDFPEQASLVALEGEGPYEIHNLRDIDLYAQTLQIPQNYFEGLIDHEVASFNAPISGIILRDDGLKIEEGAVRLLERDPETGDPTGWEVQGRINNVRALTLGQIKKFSDTTAQKYGYQSTDDMVGHVSKMFADKKLKPRDTKNKVWVIDFEDIDASDPQTGMAYYNPESMKVSAMQTDYDSIAEEMELAA